MNDADSLLAAFESHSVRRIDAILQAGFDIQAPINGMSPVNHLIEMYYRSDEFPACLPLQPSFSSSAPMYMRGRRLMPLD